MKTFKVMFVGYQSPIRKHLLVCNVDEFANVQVVFLNFSRQQETCRGHHLGEKTNKTMTSNIPRRRALLLRSISRLSG